MKVLTLTTQYANNMGAQLQCYALSRYLNSLNGIECQVIQYFPVNSNRSWTFFNKPRSFRELAKNITVLLNPSLLRSKLKKQKIMREFIADYIPLTEEKYKNKAAIMNNPPIADAYIAGSDQIWNFRLRRDTTFFLDFTYLVEGAKRISYAPSIAEPWTKEEEQFIQPYLQRLDKVSIREIGNLEQVTRLIPEKNPMVTIDPVFLLTKDEWDKVADIKLDPGDPYILCYFLSVSDLAVKTVKKMREVTGMKVLHLNLNVMDKFNSEYNIRLASPNDFIGLIKNATYVCTNSFHCSAFSVIYKKNFVYISGMRNKRVESLQEVFGLGQRFSTEEWLKTMSNDDLTVDYAPGAKVGEEFIDKSKIFLKEALYENK